MSGYAEIINKNSNLGKISLIIRIVTLAVP